MPDLVPGIRVFLWLEDVDDGDIGERSDAVLRTSMPDHDNSRKAERHFFLHSSALTEPTCPPRNIRLRNPILKSRRPRRSGRSSTLPRKDSASARRTSSPTATTR